MRSGPVVWISVVVAAVVVLYGIASVLAVPRSAWTERSRRRSNWIWMMLLFGPLAVLLFFGTVRQHLMHPKRYEVIDGVAEADR